MIDKQLLEDIIDKYYWYKIHSIQTKDRLNETYILVKAIETKAVYGRIDVLVKPIVGKGQFWVKYDKLFLEEIPFGIIAESVSNIQLR